MPDGIHPASFLSHLCGGEGFYYSYFFLFRFLSHLCGGEAFSCYNSYTVQFLSHLCGGEALNDYERTDAWFSKPPMRW